VKNKEKQVVNPDRENLEYFLSKSKHSMEKMRITSSIIKTLKYTKKRVKGHC
jgi:hypothetical protein